MTSAVCTKSDVPRWFLSHTAQRWFSARHTCSSVISGFFPPQPIRPLGDEAKHQQTQEQMPDQPYVVPSLEVPETDLGLADAEGVFDGPAIMPSKTE